MADITLYTNEGALGNATRQQTYQALSKVRLFNSTLSLGPSTSKVELVAAEAVYTGYASGGIEITAFLDPILAASGGYSILAPAVQFQVGASPTATDLIGGFWLEDAAGGVLLATQFGTPQPMQFAGQGIPVTIQQTFGN